VEPRDFCALGITAFFAVCRAFFYCVPAAVAAFTGVPPDYRLRFGDLR